MNMHGIIEPVEFTRVEKPSLRRRTTGWLRRNRVFMLVVVVPSLLVAGYLYLIASNQYEAEAHFLVHSSDPSSQSGLGMSQMLSAATGLSAGQNEAMSVSDYLTSHDAVATLRRDDALVQRFHRADADLLSRLRTADPTPETLLKYFRRQVNVKYNTETGITTLTVHTFTPQDSFEIARKLLDLGEQRVNEMNERSYRDAVALSQKQVGEAETALSQNQERMTHFRQSRADIDPQASGQAQIGLVTGLSEQLAAARAQLAAMAGFIEPSSPQYRALSAKVSALQRQVSAQSGRLAGSSDAIATDIGSYEELKLRQQFLAKRYDAAASALQRAREQALRQQLYVVRVVDPNMPVKSLFPQRGRILATVVVGLLLAYSIGWLIMAGVREHAA